MINYPITNHNKLNSKMRILI